jgi:hypothetical protein
MRRANALAYLIDIVAYLELEVGGTPENNKNVGLSEAAPVA